MSRSNNDNGRLQNLITLQDCKCWNKNKTINPMTGRAISLPTSSVSSSVSRNPTKWGDILLNKCDQNFPEYNRTNTSSVDNCEERSNQRSKLSIKELIRMLENSTEVVASRNRSPAASRSSRSPAAARSNRSPAAARSSRSPAAARSSRETPVQNTTIKYKYDVDTGDVYNEDDCTIWMEDRTKHFRTEIMFELRPSRGAPKLYGPIYNRLLEYCDLYNLIENPAVPQTPLNDIEKDIIKNRGILNLKIKKININPDKFDLKIYAETFQKLIYHFKDWTKDDININNKNLIKYLVDKRGLQISYFENSIFVIRKKINNFLEDIEDIENPENTFFQKFIFILEKQFNLYNIYIKKHYNNTKISNYIDNLTENYNNYKQKLNDEYKDHLAREAREREAREREAREREERERQARERERREQREQNRRERERELQQIRMQYDRDEEIRKYKGILDKMLDPVNGNSKKSIQSNSIQHTEDININCIDTFNKKDDIQQYKNFNNLMKRTCNYYINHDKKLDNDTKDLHVLFKEYIDRKSNSLPTEYAYIPQNNHHHTLLYYSKYIYKNEDSNFEIKIPALYSLLIWYLNVPEHDYTFLKYGKKSDNHSLSLLFTIEYDIIIDHENAKTSQKKNIGCDYGGLSRVFFKKVLDDLKELEIFITNEHTNKYFLNPNFKFDHNFYNFYEYYCDFNKNIQKHVNDNYILTKLYTMIGKFLSFCILNNFSLDFDISSYLIANFIYENDKIKDNDKLYYMLLDFPDMTKALLNLMNEPENINETLNDNLTLENIRDVTKLPIITQDNYIEFLYLLANHISTKSILLNEPTKQKKPKNPHNIDIDITERYKLLVNGIYKDLKKLLFRKHLSLSYVNKLLCKNHLDRDALSKIIVNLKKYISNKSFIQGSTTDEIEKKYNEILKYFIKILSGGPIQYDNDITKLKDHKEKEEKYMEIMEAIIEFWSGYNKYNDNDEYKFKIISDKPINSLPVSHTCFTTLDIPYYNSENMLYNKLKFAALNVKGFQIAGSKRKSKKNQKKIS